MKVLQALLLGAFSFLWLPSGNAQQASMISLPGLYSWKGDFDGMVERHAVRVLIPFSRTAFFLDKGEALGFEAELAHQLEQWLDKRHAKRPYHFQVALIPTHRDRLFSDLVEGKGDVAAGNLTITAERSAIADFVLPWATGVKEVLVTGPSAPAIKSIDDLAGHEIKVRKSSSYYSHVAKVNEKFSFWHRIKVTAADENLEDEDILEMVSGGLLPWAVVDRHKAAAWASLLKGLTVREDIVFNEGGEIAWAIRKNSPILKKELDGFVSKHKLGTSFGNEIRERYFKSVKAIKDALADSEKDKLKALLPYFQKYGKQYSIDPWLVAAQGYQESGFNQNDRSRAGAVGIMQLLPSTASGEEVGIKDIVSSAENNIHAGTKYLRYLADNHVTGADIDARERVLMALAAYNAGPNNLAKFQDFAEKHGLKKNIWFGNVEHGAAAIVGQETVQYVGNIYKYYLAYAGAGK